MKIELRWFKSVDGEDYKLQYREAYYENWQDVPFEIVNGANRVINVMEKELLNDNPNQ